MKKTDIIEETLDSLSVSRCYETAKQKIREQAKKEVFDAIETSRLLELEDFYQRMNLYHKTKQHHLSIFPKKKKNNSSLGETIDIKLGKKMLSDLEVKRMNKSGDN